MRWTVLLVVSSVGCGRVDFGAVSARDAAQASNCALVDLSAGDGFTCGLDAAGAVWCWGRNNEGEADPTTVGSAVLAAAAKIALPAAAVELRSGHGSSCARLGDGTVWCWGDNTDGRLGDGTTTGHGPTRVALGGEQAIAIGVGAAMACAQRASDHAVECWGSNRHFALGNTGPDPQPTPTLVAGTAGARQLSVVDLGACFVDSTGAIECWGRDGFQSAGGTGDHAAPTTISSTSGAQQIAGVGAVKCMTLAGGVRCWGKNDWGELGNGAFAGGYAGSALPSTTVAASNVAEVHVGSTFSIALRTDGSLATWGATMYDGLAEARATAAVPSLNGVTKLAVGRSHACAIASGQVSCWGVNFQGALGRGTESWSPTLQPGGLAGTIDLIATGGSATCGRVGGQLYCWGDNMTERLGDGTTRSSVVPQVVTTGLQSIAGFAIRDHACAWGAGTLRCWGRGDFGQLGTGSALANAPGFAPVTVPLANVTAAALGGQHTCAIAGGAVSCWGRNQAGELGDGTTTNRASPTTVSGVTSPAAIAAARSVSCALDAAGTVQCWGDNSSGQLGDGTTTNRSSPVTAILPSAASAIAVGGAVCAVLMTGDLYCWGHNGDGEVGDGTTTNRPTPIHVVLPASVKWVATGDHDTCARLSTGAVYCWGGSSGGVTPTHMPAFDDADQIAYGDWEGCMLRGGALACNGNKLLLGNGDASDWMAQPITLSCGP